MACYNRFTKGVYCIVSQDGYMAFLQLEDLQWMIYCQNDLLGCIFGKN